MDFSKIIGMDETIPVSVLRHEYVHPSAAQTHLITNPSVYPAVDPASAYAAQVLAGKVVLITGASRGIGRTIALYLARAGASLALVARDASALAQTKAAVLSIAPQANVIVSTIDVRDTAAAEAAVEEAAKHFGRLDVLVANAGAATPMTKRTSSACSPSLVI
jgi:predicted amino acid dehydrogenase